MNGPAIPVAKEILRALTVDEAREIAEDALHLDSAEAVQELVRARFPLADLQGIL